MKTVKSTKGEWKVKSDNNNYFTIESENDIICSSIILDETLEEQFYNAKLIADAGTTANKCGLLPSELLKQRNKLLAALKRCDNLFDIIQKREGLKNDNLRYQVKKAIKSCQIKS